MDAYVDTSADVNLILKNRYVKLHNDGRLRHIMPSDIKLGVWGDDQIALLGKCNIYLVHPDKKKPVKVTFYVADKSGSTLLSCATSLKLDLIKLHLRLGVPPPRAKIITSQADQTSPAAKRVTQGKVVFDEIQSTGHVPSVKPLTTLFRGLLQPCTGAPFKREPSVIDKWARYQNDQHDETSSMVPRSALYDCPVQPPFKPCTAPFRTPIQNPCTGALFKREPSVIDKWARYQNDQHDETSSMVPRSALYDCPVQPPFNPCTAPFRTPIQNPCTGALFKRELSVIGKWARYQNDQHDETSSMVPRSAPYNCPISPHSSLLWPHSEPPFKIPKQEPCSKENCWS